MTSTDSMLFHSQLCVMMMRMWFVEKFSARFETLSVQGTMFMSVASMSGLLCGRPYVSAGLNTASGKAFHNSRDVMPSELIYTRITSKVNRIAGKNPYCVSMCVRCEKVQYYIGQSGRLIALTLFGWARK